MRTFNINLSENVGVEIQTDGKGFSQLLNSSLKAEENEDSNDDDFNFAMDGIESLLIAMAANGIDIGTPEMKQALNDAYEGCGNNV